MAISLAPVIDIISFSVHEACRELQRRQEAQLRTMEYIRGTCEILSGPGTGRYTARLPSVLVTGKPEAVL
jgi:hypothetical protein